jgi:hypothetical protein
MNKTIRIALVLVIIVVAIVLAAHVSNFDSVMRRLHGG